MDDFYEDFKEGIEAFFELIGYRVEVSDLVNSDLLIFATPVDKTISCVLVYFFSQETNAHPETLRIPKKIAEEYRHCELIAFSENDSALKNYQGLRYDSYLFLSAYPDFFKQFMSIFATSRVFHFLAKASVKIHESRTPGISIQDLNEITDSSYFIDKLENYPFISNVNNHLQFENEAFVEYFVMQEFNLFDQSTHKEKFRKSFSPLMLMLIDYTRAPSELVALKKLREEVVNASNKLLEEEKPKSLDEVQQVDKLKRYLDQVVEVEIVALVQHHWPHYNESELHEKQKTIRLEVNELLESWKS